MIRVEMESYIMILTEKQQKYQHYHLEQVDRYEYLTSEEILPSDQRRVTEQAKLHILLEKKLQKNKQKQLRIKVKSK